MAALAMVDGYLERTIGEHIACVKCFSFIPKPAFSVPPGALIKCQDRGGLLYPYEKLLAVVYCLSKFINIALTKGRNLEHLLNAVAKATEVLQEREVLMCAQPGHHEKLLNILLTKFFRPLIVR